MATKKDIINKVAMLNEYGMSIDLRIDFKKYDKYTLIFNNLTGTHTFNIMHFQTTKEINTYLDGIVFIVVNKYVQVRSAESLKKDDKKEWNRIHKNDYKIISGYKD